MGGTTPAAATVTTLTASGDFTYDSIVQPKVKIIDIGDWDMSTATGSGTVNVVHGLTYGNIRSVSATIRDDAGTTTRDFMSKDNTETSATQIVWIGVNVTLVRGAGGYFDNATHDATSYNRGWVTIHYV